MFDLEDKAQMKIAILEPASSVRQMQVDTLRGFGFQNIQSFGSGKEALGYLETEAPDWLIMGSLDLDEVNSIHLLKIISENGCLRNIRTSLIIDLASEAHILSLAFELGLMSYHPKTFSKDDFESGFNDLFTIFSMNEHDPVLVAARYIRTHLQELGAKKSILALSETILKMYPGNTKVLFGLAEAQFLNDRAEDGENTLCQVTMLDPRLKAAATRLLQKNTDKKDFDDGGTSKGANILGVKSAVVVEPDGAALQQIEAQLKKCGVKVIETFEDGEQAWGWIKSNPEPGIIIQEWRITGLTGPLLVQRVRNHGYIQVPIIVTSSLLGKDDIPLVLEMGVDKVVEKPFHDEEFIAAVIWTVQQNARPSESKSIEIKVRRSIDAGKMPDAMRLLTHYINDERVAPHKKLQLQAEFQFAEGHILKAKELCTQIIDDGEANVFTLNLLGRILLELKHYQAAYQALERAHKMCPMNISRLIDMADIKMHEGDLEIAGQSIEQAEAIDAEAEIVKEAGCRLALESGDTDKASDLFGELDSASKVISYMNNRAVALARIGHFEDSIAMYQKTIEALPKKMQDASLAVQYNLSLAHARYGDYDQAIESLAKIADAKHRIGQKASVLHQRLKTAQESGASIEFKEATREEVLAGQGEESIDSFDLSTKAALESLSIDPGDICCHKIFFFLEGHDKRCERMLKSLPRFNSREKIERERTNTDLRSA